MSRNSEPAPSRPDGGRVDRQIDRRDLSAVIIYPNTRDVAFASLGYLKVYELFGRTVHTADLSFLPLLDGTSEGPRDGARVPGATSVLSPRQRLLLGFGSRIEVNRFDLVTFSVSYENDYVYIPRLLTLAGMAPLARDRTAPSAADRSPPAASDRTPAFPLVICGGFAMAVNPLPIADFADIVVVGEAEGVLGPMLEVLEKGKHGNASKQDVLRGLSAIDGLYIPSLGEQPVKRLWCDAGAFAAEPETHVTSHFGDMFLVEVGRGCGRGCLFCAAGNLYRPVRMREAGAVLQACGSAERLGLVGTAVGDHPALVSIMDRLWEAGREVGISSLRADQVTPEVAVRLARCGVRSVAIAPETGTESLRRRIRKGVSDAQVFDAVRALSDAGISTIKLYFMIGLPGETDADAEAIVSLVTSLASVRGRAKLSVAAGPFVPKPHTALQWAPFAARDVLKRRAGLLKRISRLRGCSVSIGAIDEAYAEAVLARGDRSLSGALLEASREKRPVKALLKQSGLPDPCLELDTAKPLPWDFIDNGVSRKGLLKQYLESTTT